MIDEKIIFQAQRLLNVKTAAPYHTAVMQIVIEKFSCLVFVYHII